MLTGPQPNPRVWIPLLALLGLLRVALGALSFPFFGHMDEIAHVDVVLRYAQGEWPIDAGDAFSPETLELFAIVNSPEFGLPPDASGQVAPIPAMFDWPDEVRANHIAHVLAEFAAGRNHEAFEAPPYYAIAAVWRILGKSLGIEGLHGLYWLRMLGAIAVAIGVVFTALLLRNVAPGRPLLWFGGALLLAVWPQDVFYFVNNDVPNIALFPLALWLLQRIREPADARGTNVVMATLTGLVIGTAAVGKGTALPILLMAIVWLAPTAWRAWRQGERRAWLCCTSIVGLACALFLVWQVYLYAATGHSGAEHKLGLLGITPRPIAEWGEHPLFGAEGAFTFVWHLVLYFWRGELRWHGAEMCHFGVDVALFGTTFLALAAHLWHQLRERAHRLPARFAVMAWSGIAASVAIMIVLSIAHDMGPNMYPSREFPYFTSGRLLCGIFPLVIALCLHGMSETIRYRRASWLGLVIITLVLATSEAVLMQSVVASPHNFWHLTVR